MNSVFMFFYYVYIVMISLIIGANFYTDIFCQLPISFGIFFIVYALGKCIFEGKKRRDWEHLLLSVIIFAFLSLAGLTIIEIFNVFMRENLEMTLKNITWLKIAAYISISTLAAELSFINNTQS